MDVRVWIKMICTQNAQEFCCQNKRARQNYKHDHEIMFQLLEMMIILQDLIAIIED